MPRQRSRAVSPPPRRHRPVAGVGKTQTGSALNGWDHSPKWLRVPAGYAWRLLAIAAAVYLVAVVAGMLQFVFVALFVAIVLTAVLRPLVGAINKVLPRSLAVVISFLAAIAVVGGMFTFIGVSVASQAEELGEKFSAGITEIGSWLEKGPLPISHDDINNALKSAQEWVFENRGDLLSQALNSASTVVELLAGLALAVFCAIFFIHSGSTIWNWFLLQLPNRTRERWAMAGDAAWGAFAGYTRGIFIVAATNGMFAAIALWILQVPLALPLGLLVFIGTFIPLIGSPLAMAIATVVALAARGPVIALISMGLIVLIGQFEGNVLQPLVMGKQVSLHPVVVAIAVAVGTILAGVIGAVVAVPIVAVVWAVFAKLRPNPDPKVPVVVAESN